MTPTGMAPAPGRGGDLLCFSHLRWDWVWQRPQHLLTRLATEAILAERPDARFIHVGTAEGHGALDGESAEFVRHLNQRRFLFHDLILGRADTAHPLWPQLRDAGGLTGEDLAWFRAHAACINVLGLDYYAHCEHQYHARYGLPLMLTETNIRGYVSDRISWLRHMVEQCEGLVAEGLPFEGSRR